MCGILGLVHGPTLNKQRFEKALSLLAHRGPDSTKIQYYKDITFGFNRLAIQDLSTFADQPMSLKDAPVHIVFNGEIYNYKRLRKELQDHGAQFFSHSDTEVILQGYKIWGLDETISRLEGMFGFGIYDERTSTLILARDRFGQKPLFYSYNDHEFIFSSEAKAILHYTQKAKLNFFAALNPLMTTGLPPRGETIFEGVRQLEEGQYLKYQLRNTTFEIKKYFSVLDWVSPTLHKELCGYSSDKMLETYDKAFDESLEKHLVSDTPLGCMFSAGIDSSLVTAFALRHQKINTYHFESELLDFLKYPKFFAQRYNVDLKIAKGEDRNYVFDLPRMAYHYETINKDEGPVLAQLCRFARKDGIKALLTGDASDELFGGYYSHRDFYNQTIMYHSPVARKITNLLRRAFPANIFQAPMENPTGIHYFMAPQVLSLTEVPLNCLLHKGERLGEWQKCLEACAHIEDIRQRQMTATLLDEVNYRLQRFMLRADRYGMMESVELRAPFLDPLIVKLAINTPLAWRMKPKIFARGFEQKYILKELALKKGMPRWYAYRKKQITPHNTPKYITEILKRWPLKQTAEFLCIRPDTLQNVLLNSFDPYLFRAQYAFLNMEMLIRIFILGERHESISEEFRSILK